MLGQKLVARISQDHGQGHTLLATGRGEKRFSINAQYTPMDIANKSEIERIFSDFRPDAVVNTAAMTNVDQCELNQEDCFQANVTATKHLVDACESFHSFFLHLSTDFIFDGTHGPLREDETAAPVNYYGETKLEAEKLILSSNIKWAIARTVLVYGIVEDMSRSNIILWVRDSLTEGKTIRVVDDQFRTPTLAEDLADGCFRILDQKAEGIFHISGSDFLTPYQMANITADYFGLDKSLIVKTDSTAFTQPAKRPLKTGFILDKARNILGYAPHSFEEGIEIVTKQVDNRS